ILLALRKGGFSRSLKASVRLPNDDDAEGFAARVGLRLEEAALSRLGLARRAGVLALGKDGVRDAGDKALAYLTPTDVSPPEADKLARYLHKAHNVPHVELPVDRARLAPAIGRDSVHLAPLRGGPGGAALASVLLWTGFSE
ncbi:MAG: hypothetical protein V2I43_03985, partial [Parvularcula sp.]|nr:hypothetical protein [Parvularcula sp.]